MEMSFMDTYCMGSALRGMLSSDALPEELKRFRPIIETAVGNDSRGSLLSDLMIFGADVEPSPQPKFDENSSSQLPGPTYDALLARVQTDESINEGVKFVAHNGWKPGESLEILSPNADVMRKVSNRGLTYKDCNASVGDSLVIFKLRVARQKNALGYGHIVSIFSHRRNTHSGKPRVQIFAAVRQFAGLTPKDQQYDPYRKFKHLRINLIYRSPLPSVEVIPVKDIIAHFASCPYEERHLSKPCMIAVAMDRVRRIRSL